MHTFCRHPELAKLRCMCFCTRTVPDLRHTHREASCKPRWCVHTVCSNKLNVHNVQQACTPQADLAASTASRNNPPLTTQDQQLSQGYSSSNRETVQTCSVTHLVSRPPCFLRLGPLPEALQPLACLTCTHLVTRLTLALLLLGHRKQNEVVKQQQNAS